MAAAPGSLAGAAGGIGGLIGGSNQSSGTSFLSPDQLPYLQDLFSRASQFSQTPGFVGTDPLQTQGQESALGAAQGLSPLLGGAQSANEFLLGSVLDPSSNPFLAASAQAATRPVFEGLMQNILPGIRNQAAQTGNVGSSRQGIAEGLASQGALNTAGDISTNIFSGGYGQGLGALIQGLGLAPQTANLGLLPSQIQQQVGGQRRLAGQEEAFAPFEQLQRFQELLGQPITLNQQESSGGTGLSGLFGTGGLLDLGGGGGGAGGGAATLLTGGANKLLGL